MTGEITLTGQVLPIGGIREKTLAAQRAGLKRVIVPRENEPDLEELPPETRAELEFVLVDTVEEVFEAAFGARTRRAAAGAARHRKRQGRIAQKVCDSAQAGIRRNCENRTAKAKEGLRWRRPGTNTGAAGNVRPYVERAVQTKSSART